MRVSNAFVGLNLAELFPDSAIKSKNLGIFIADYHARRDDARAARRQAAVPDSHYDKLLKRFDEILSELTRLRDTSLTDPFSMQAAKAKKQTNRLHKCINELDRAEKETPFGKTAENLIFTIASIVMRDLESIAASQPMNAYQYLTGKYKHYWLTTTTQSLTTGLHRNSLGSDIINASASEKRAAKKFQNKVSNFRGKGGLYEQLEAAGFILDNVVDGNKVRLKVNLEWIFGWSINILEDPSVIAEMTDFAPDPRGENAPNAPLGSGAEPFFSDFSRDNITCFSQNNKFKETEYRENGVATLQENSPTIVGEKEKESEEKETRRAENPSGGGEIFEEKEEKNGAAPAASDDAVLTECAKDSANRALKQIFNKKNVENGRIKYGAASPAATISTDDIRHIRYWMLGAYTHIHNLNPSNDWLRVAEMVNEAINDRAKYLEKYIQKYNYHPKDWLNPQFSGGTLTKYVERYLLNRPEKQATIGYTDVLNGQYSPNIAWLIGQGADKEAVFAHIRRFAADGYDGEKTINDAIGVVRGKLLIDTKFKPKKGICAYAFGTFYKVNPSTIGLDAEKLRVKWVEKQKEAASTAYWTPQKVKEALFEKTAHPQMQYLRAFVSDIEIQAFSKTYSKRPSTHEYQLKDDLERLAKKNRDAQAAA